MYQFKTGHRRLPWDNPTASSPHYCSSLANSLHLELSLSSFLVFTSNFSMELALPDITVASAASFPSPRLQALWGWRESSSNIDTCAAFSMAVTTYSHAGFGQHNPGMAILRDWVVIGSPYVAQWHTESRICMSAHRIQLNFNLDKSMKSASEALKSPPFNLEFHSDLKWKQIIIGERCRLQLLSLVQQYPGSTAKICWQSLQDLKMAPVALDSSKQRAFLLLCSLLVIYSEDILHHFSDYRTACDDNVKLGISAEICFIGWFWWLTRQIEISCLYFLTGPLMLLSPPRKRKNKHCKMIPWSVLQASATTSGLSSLSPYSLSFLVLHVKLGNTIWQSVIGFECLGWGACVRWPTPQGALEPVVKGQWWV